MRNDLARTLGILPALALLCWTAVAEPSSLPRSDFWVPDGPVRAILEHKGVLYVAGTFEYISPVSETGGAFETVSGFADPDFPRFAGAIKAIVSDNVGGWFIGGQFTAVGGWPITNLAHIRANRTVDAGWAPNPDDAVLALATDGVRLFVGGWFTTIGGVSRSGLAALSPDSGAAITSWQADCTSRYGKGSVNALVVSDGRLYAAGYFSHIAGMEREYVGSVNADSGQVDPWVPNRFNATAAGSQIDALAISGNVLYVGGTFSQVGGNSSNGVLRGSVAALDVLNTTNSVLPWNPNANGAVKAITVSCGVVYLGGAFTSVGGEARHHIAAVDAFTGRATAWNSDANGDVLTMTLAGDALYVGGKFTEIAGEQRKFLAQVDIPSGRAGPWTANADFGVTAIAASGSAVVTGGALGSGGKIRHHVAAFDAETGKLLEWAPQVSGGTTNSDAPAEGVYALAALGNAIYMGGPFTQVNGQTRNHLAAVDARDGALSPWNPDANGIVDALMVSVRTVYVGGLFSSVNGAMRQNIAAVRSSTGEVLPWNPGANDKVKSIQRSGGRIYVGGLFTQIGGAVRKRVAALDAKNGEATPWRPEISDQVGALEILGSRVFCGGTFSRVNGEPRSRVAALGLARGNITCWDPNARFQLRSSESAAAVNAMATMGGTVYLGGFFNTVAGEPRNGLAAVSLKCPSQPLPWSPSVDNSVHVITCARGIVYVGGNFQRVGGTYRPNFAVFSPERAPRIVLQPTNQLAGVGEPVVFDAGATGPGRLRYQWQLNGANIPGATSSTLSIANVQPADAGEYVLVVASPLGQVSSRAAALTVLQPLNVVSQPTSQAVAPGATVSLSVVVEGSPEPYFQWRRNGVNIPGANSSTLTITNAQPADGGSYEVVADNLVDALTSDVATLHVSSPTLAFSDQFESRGTMIAEAGVGSGSNVLATHQDGETNHPGLLGNSSVWITWVAPSNGVATFSTRGSDFDTILAVYNGTNINALAPVASDDDRGGFYTSEVSFNAVAGSEYAIAVDGFSGATGNIVLTWDLDTSTTPLPRIISQPQNLVVTQSATATFFVRVFDATNTTRYQWFLGCHDIQNGTNDTLTITNVQSVHVGNYRVIVQNQWGRTAESAEAALEIGPESQVATSDKGEDLPDDAPLLVRRKKTIGTPGIISVSIGTIDNQLFNNVRARTSLREPNHCRISGGASRFLDLRAAEPGVFVIDTVGSTIDTVLAVYYRTNLSKLSANQVACDNNGAPDGVRSLVRFPAIAGRDYRAFVDGVRGSKGRVTLNWKLGEPPAFKDLPVLTNSLGAGANAMLEAVTTNMSPVLQYQWLRDGSAIIGATNATLLVTPELGAGAFKVIAGNEFGFATNLIAVFTAIPSPALAASLPRFEVLGLAPRLADGSFGLLVAGISGTTFVVEASSDLLQWHPVSTNLSGGAPVYIELHTPISPQQFFRARAVRP